MDPEREGRGREAREQLSSARTLGRSTAFQIGGQLAVIATGILAIPLLINLLGTARFGVLTLVWVVIGYASIFDLGLGRALTKLTAEKLGSGREAEIPALFWTATKLIFLLGVGAGVLLAILSPFLVDNVLKIPAGLEGETRVTFLMLAATLPFVLLSASLRGNLEAHQRFDLTNAISVPLSVLSFFGPVVIALIEPNLAAATSAVVLSRLIGCVVTLILCQRLDPGLKGGRKIDRRLVRPLLSFGGWVTVASIFAPLMVTLDRFIIGALVSATAVAYYATPYEAVRRLLVASGAMSAVLFPAFSANVSNDPGRAERLFRRGTRAVLISLFPLSLVVAVFAREILGIWVGSEFADHSTNVMQWLAGGTFLNGLAFVAFGMVQSARPDLIAKLLFLELPIYLTSFWLLIGGLGIEGAAIAWAGRVTLDAAGLYLILLRIRLVSMPTVRSIAMPAGACVAVLAVGSQLGSLPVKLAFFSATITAFALLTWFRMLEDRDRARLVGRFRRVRSAV